MKKAFPYDETILHWLWKNRYLHQQHILTARRKELIIHHPGYQNASDGPDFTNARITIGALKWHGDVEIHWSTADWRKHQHHTDSNYNRVILHVVFDDPDARKVKCSDGSCPPLFVMKPFLAEPLQYFFKQYRQVDRLPCAGNLADVPESVLKEQFEQAHAEYFEQKVDDLLSFYDPKLPLSKAWLGMLVVGLFDGLGVTHNREPMRRLAADLMKQKKVNSCAKLTEHALREAGIEPEDEHAPYTWKRKGSRPANHPKVRIRQAAAILYYLQNQPIREWLHADIKTSFNAMRSQINTTPGLGSHQSNVLLGTVWMPAFYLLGKLTGTHALQHSARQAWTTHRTKLPRSIAKNFSQCAISSALYKQKLGAVHQYRAYCKPHLCQHCEVFKHIISA